MKNKLYFTILSAFISLSVFAQTSIPCNQNKFWAVRANNDIDQYSLSGGTATFDSTFILNSFSNSIAICNNLDSVVAGPTFYNTNSNQIAFYNGNSWSISSVTPPYLIYNGGGYENYLYFTANMGVGYDAVVRYDGTTITPVYTLANLPNRRISVADLAVDKYGNVWLFTGNTTSLITDSLSVISPGGQVLSQYYVNFNTQAAYGCFLINDIIYVGFGQGNSAYPHSLLPISIINGTAVNGTAIALPAGINYADLASCSKGDEVSINDMQLNDMIDIYPNPASDYITISSSNINSNNEYNIYSIDGAEQLKGIRPSGQNFKLNIQSLSPGLYILTREGGNVERRLFMKL